MKKYIFRKDHYFARISWLAYLLFYSLKCMSCRNNCAEKYNCKTVFGLKLDIFLTTELEGILRGGNGEGEKERKREREREREREEAGGERARNSQIER